MKAMEQLEQELALLNSGIEPSTEERSPELKQMPLAKTRTKLDRRRTYRPSISPEF